MCAAGSTACSEPASTPAFYVNAVPARGGRSSPRHQDLREGPAPEALLFDDVQLQVLSQFGERAAPRADRDGDRRQLVFVDGAKACRRLGEARAVVDQDRPFFDASLDLRYLRRQDPAE